MKRTGWVMVGAAAGFALGQSVAWAQGTTLTPQATDVWNALITSGPLASLLGFILWRVDSERRQLQKERDALLERVITGLNNATTTTTTNASTIASLGVAINALADHVRFQDRGGRA